MNPSMLNLMFSFVNLPYTYPVWYLPRTILFSDKKEIGVPVDVKYIDPAYMIRACHANASGGILCAVLGQNAVRLFLSPKKKTQPQYAAFLG